VTSPLWISFSLAGWISFGAAEAPLLGCVQGKPRRWVVERTNAWHNRFRGLLVRWERIGSPYLALLHLACALIAFRQVV
jgi:hypothetical protein